MDSIKRICEAELKAEQVKTDALKQRDLIERETTVKIANMFEDANAKRKEIIAESLKKAENEANEICQISKSRAKAEAAGFKSMVESKQDFAQKLIYKILISM